MKRIMAVSAMVCAILVFISPNEAPAENVHRIGYLSARSAAQDKRLLPAFLKGLREQGYIEGKNIAVEMRSTGGKRGLLSAMAKDLVRQKVDVIVTSGGAATLAARKATKRIPIVFAVSADPVGIGLVASLARPGGNITGLSDSHSDLIAKRLELLREVVPSASRIAVLWNPATSIHPAQWKQIQVAAPRFGVALLSLEVRNPPDLTRAFAEIEKKRPGGLVVFGHSSIAKFRRRISEFSLRNRLPAIYTHEGWVINGGFMSYGADFLQLWRRAAHYVGKILKGAKPADLPVEQPTKFDLVINLKTAKEMGVDIPPELLLRATKVIR